jgi:hypothetical protein
MTCYYSVLDNITFYRCDVSRWDEVEKVAKQIVDEVTILAFGWIYRAVPHALFQDWPPNYNCEQRWRCSR